MKNNNNNINNNTLSCIQDPDSEKYHNFDFNDKIILTSSRATSRYASDDDDDDQAAIQVFPCEKQQIDSTPTLQDRFASALLRLQSDLDESCQRVEELKLRITKLEKSSSSSSSVSSSRPFSIKNALLSNLVPLAYLGWPMLVYLAMRAYERKLMLSHNSHNV